MSFARPELLVLLALAPLVVALALTTRQRRVLGARLVAVTALRAALLAALALALAGPVVLRVVAPPRARTHVYVVDVSLSVDPTQALEALSRDLARLPQGDRAGVVAAAGSAVWVRPVDDAPLDHAALAAALSRAAAGHHDASHLARGLRLARAGAPARAGAEVVLVSDGRETDAPGEAALEAARLAASGVAVRALPVGRDGDDARAVDLTGDPAPFVHEGAGVLLTARVAGPSSRDGGAREVEVRLERDGVTRPEWTRRLRLGPEVVPLTFADRAERAGVQRYLVTVTTPGDVEPRNDRAALALEVRGGPRVLVVSEDAAAAGAVPPALSAAGFTLEQVGPREAPSVSRDLERFDAVVLVDVPAREDPGSPPALTDDAQRALLAYAQAGGGVLVVGGARSFGPGGYRGRPIEDLLPVRSEPPAWAEVPDVALVLLVDRSGSMGRGPKLEMAKVAAREAATFLGARDLLGVVGFRADATWLVEPTQGAAQAIVREVLSVQAAGGGTDLLPALELASRALATSTARVKHVVVLSDGIAPRLAEVLTAVGALRAAGVTTSTVAVGADADQDMLRRVAEAGGGRFHGAADLSKVPRIVADEALDASRRSAETEPFRPRVARAARALRDVHFEQGPALTGLLPTEARAEAEVLLTDPEGRPLLATWDVGAGRCAAWTSDAGARWARALVGWDGFTRLLGQLVRAVARPPDARDLTAPLAARLDGDRLHVDVSGPGQGSALVLEALDDPDGPDRPVDPDDPDDPDDPPRAVTLPLDAVASDRRRADGPAPPDGLYRARVLDGPGGPGRLLSLGPGLLTEVASGLGPDHAALDAIAAAGRPVTAPAARLEPRSLVTPLLLLACALLLAEVVVRRLR